MAPVVPGNFFQSNRTVNSTRFVTICGYVQSNIQHVSPAYGGFASRPHRGSAPGPRWGTSVQKSRSEVVHVVVLVPVFCCFICAVYLICLPTRAPPGPKKLDAQIMVKIILKVAVIHYT